MTDDYVLLGLGELTSIVTGITLSNWGSQGLLDNFEGNFAKNSGEISLALDCGFWDKIESAISRLESQGMDPVSIIMAALVAGAAKPAGEVASDAYNALKALIKRGFAGNEGAKVVLDEHEKDPETYEVPLKKKLTEAKIDQDGEVIKAAEELLRQLKPEEASASKYNIQVAGDMKIGIQGDVSGGKIDQTIN